jgi:hypothetical protein
LRNTVSGAPVSMGQLARHEGFEPAAAAFRAKGWRSPKKPSQAVRIDTDYVEARI